MAVKIAVNAAGGNKNRVGMGKTRLEGSDWKSRRVNSPRGFESLPFRHCFPDEIKENGLLPEAPQPIPHPPTGCVFVAKVMSRRLSTVGVKVKSYPITCRVPSHPLQSLLLHGQQAIPFQFRKADGQ
jgi:hypothetical protein